MAKGEVPIITPSTGVGTCSSSPPEKVHSRSRSSPMAGKRQGTASQTSNTFGAEPLRVRDRLWSFILQVFSL